MITWLKNRWMSYCISKVIDNNKYLSAGYNYTDETPNGDIKFKYLEIRKVN